MGINDYSIEELEEALEDKKAYKLHLDKPVPLDNIDFKPIIEMFNEYIDEIEDAGYADEDFPHSLYETMMETIYGKDAWNWINKFF